MVCFLFRLEVSVKEEEDEEEEGGGENSSDWLQSECDLSVGAAYSKIKITLSAISVVLTDTLRISTSFRVISTL